MGFVRTFGFALMIASVGAHAGSDNQNHLHDSEQTGTLHLSHEFFMGPVDKDKTKNVATAGHVKFEAHNVFVQTSGVPTKGGVIHIDKVFVPTSRNVT